ncbi:TPM domain-containing protein [Lacrimispora sp. NSJ-141]|uniref:TPM domain-containing protein n=1 Tax=Lientehia hominis TaxID=2897778 RepID=A0AAP2W9K0_9FIRM|nr:TPM domain-containing protein [Lientehia hominis]MCD2492012.1 TPM domain-containing protein [Lientehia hominis]
MIRKRLIGKNMLCILLLFIFFILCGFDSEEQKIYDEAGLLSGQEEEELQDLLVKKAQETEQDFIIVTTDDNEGKSARSYADDFYDTHKFGYEKENGSGVLLLLDMDGREVYISTAGTAIQNYTDAEIDNTLDSLIPLMKKKDYMGVCRTFIEDAGRRLTGGDEAQNGYYDADSDQFVSAELSGWQKVFTPSRILIHLAAAFVLSGIIVACIAHNRKTKMSVGSGTYLKDGQLGFRARSDRFTHTTVVTRHIPRDNDSHSSGGGYSSSHTSSGGHSHGGGGRSF